MKHKTLSSGFSQYPNRENWDPKFQKMSVPSELRILCLRLTSTPPNDLPSLVPSLVQYVLQCQIPLSTPSVNAGKADASQSAVLVHKLKTQLTTLLNGKSAPGRFAAIVLIKVVVEVGGWEILRDAGSWVRGLLSILGVCVKIIPAIHGCHLICKY